MEARIGPGLGFGDSFFDTAGVIEPKGATCRAFGVLHPGGFPQRALVIVGPDGIVKWSYQAPSPGDLPGANLIFDGLEA